MKRQILLTRQAESDLDAILTWLETRSPAGAKRWLNALEIAFKWLEDHASSSPIAPESEQFDEEIRERLFRTKRGRPYRLLFAIADKDVRILHIRGPGQDLIEP